MATVAELAVDITANTGRFVSQITGANKALKSFADPEIVGFSQRFATGLGILGGAMAAAGGAAIKMAAEFEQTEVAFTTLLGSGEEAQAFLSDLADFAAKTPFELRGLQASSRQLLAFGFQANDIIPIMTDVGDAVSALGGGQEEISRVVRALGQIQAKGKLSTEELMQMAELGIPVFEILQKEMNLTGSELESSLRKGAIGAQEGIEAIRAGLGRFEGAMEEQSKTVIGIFSNIQDNVGLIMTELGQDIIEAINLKTLLQEVGDFLDSARSILQTEGKTIVDVFKELVPPEIKQAIPFIAGIVSALLAPAFISAAAAAFRILKVFTPLGAITTALALAASFVIANWEQFQPLFEQIKSTVQTVFGFIESTILPIALEIGKGIVSGFMQIVDFFLGQWQIIKPLIFSVFDFLVTNILPIIINVINFLVQQFQRILGFWQENGPTIIGAVQNVTKVIVAVMLFVLGIIKLVWPLIQFIIQGTLESIMSIVSGAIGVILNVIKIFASLLTGNWSSLWDGVKGLVKSAFELIIGIVTTFGIGRLFKLFGRLLDDIFVSFFVVFDDIVKAVGRFLGRLIDKVKNIALRIDNIFGGLPSAMFNAGKNIILEVINGIKSVAGKLTSQVRDIVQSVKDLWPFSDAKTGPLSNLSDVDFATSILKALNQDRQKIETSIRTLLQVPSIELPAQTFGIDRTAPLPFEMTPQLEERPPSIIIENLSVREEADVERIAEQLFRLQQDRLRSRGVL